MRTQANSKSNNVANSYTGVVVNVPIQAGNWLGVDVAQANAVKAQESTKDVEAKARVEVERLAALVQAGMESLKIQKQAIEAALQARRQALADAEARIAAWLEQHRSGNLVAMAAAAWIVTAHRD